MIRTGSKKFLDPKTIRQDFVEVGPIGEGADGVVKRYLYKHIPGKYVAVKIPAHAEARFRDVIQQEISIVRKLGRSEHIVDLLGWDHHWLPQGPAVIYEYCDLGDAFRYSRKLRNELGFVPEDTLWKFFADVAKGLNYLHHCLPTPLIHGDLKPDNILVCRSVGDLSELPHLPVFKIGDLARAIEYRPSPFFKPKFQGTYEYAPPHAERATVTPSVDIWGLGACIQEFALGIFPIQQRKEFRKHWEANFGKKAFPKGRDGDGDLVMEDGWRESIPVIWRPLNATKEDQKEKWGLEHPVPPNSNALDAWYSLCMEQAMYNRVTAENLAQWLVPVAERQIVLIGLKRNVELIRKEAAQAKEKLRDLQETKARSGTRNGAPPHHLATIF